MKALLKLFCCAMAVVCLGACAADDELSNLEADGIRTRAVVPEYGVSTSNPDLISDWENVSLIYLNTPATPNIYVSAPWANSTSSSLPETFRKDIKKEDGWKMLFHTFKGIGADPKQNYICFYNMFTGFIKVFYYYEGERVSQGTQWYFMTSNGQKVALLDEPTYLTKVDSEPATNNMLLFSNMINTPPHGIENGWNGFEFQVSRYCKDLASMDFIIGAYDKLITNYDLLGKGTYKTVGTVTSASESSSGLSKTLANLAGSESKKLIDNLGSKAFGDKVFLGTKLTDLLGSITSSSYASIIRGGLKLIFGRTTITTTSEVKLTTTGSIEMGGTSSTEMSASIPAISFNLYEILNSASTYSNSNPNLVLASNSDSSSKHYLGVWTMKEKPVVCYDRVVPIKNVRLQNGGGSISVAGNVDYPTIREVEFDYEINPDLLPYIKSSSVVITYVRCHKMDGQGYGLYDMYELQDRTEMYSDDKLCLKELPEKNLQYLVTSSVPSAWENAQGFFYDWGTVKGGKLLAVATLHMTLSYQGVEKRVSLSNVYPVKYGISKQWYADADMMHHPPYAIVVNYGHPHAAGWWPSVP